MRASGRTCPRRDERQERLAAAPACESTLEDWVLGAVLSGYGQRALQLGSPAFVRHPDLVAAFRWLIEHGGVNRRYVIRDGRVVLTLPGLGEALNQVGALAVERQIEVAEALMTELPFATPSDVRIFGEQWERWRTRLALTELERRVAEGVAVDVAEEVRQLLNELVSATKPESTEK